MYGKINYTVYISTYIFHTCGKVFHFHTVFHRLLEKGRAGCVTLLKNGLKVCGEHAGFQQAVSCQPSVAAASDFLDHILYLTPENGIVVDPVSDDLQRGHYGGMVPVELLTDIGQ